MNTVGTRSTASELLMREIPDAVEHVPTQWFMATMRDFDMQGQVYISRLKRHNLDGPADLVVEIISPESRARDRGEKFYEYEEGGVKEYWLIDEPRKRAEFYRLGADRQDQSMVVKPDSRFESVALTGFWMNVDWLWQQPLPTLPHVLEMWGEKRGEVSR